MLTLRPYQEAAKAAVYEHLRSRDDHPCVVIPTGCHVAGHPILMCDGTIRPVEEVAVGDQIMGADSTPRRVLALCRGEDDLFRIEPHRGEPFVVNGNHILSLVCTNEGKEAACCKRGGEIENVAVRDYQAKSRSWKHLRKLYRVPVDFRFERDLPLPPYILGLLLGDGCLRDGVDLTTADDELAGAWERYAELVGCETTVKAGDGRCPTYTLRRGRGDYNVVTEALKALGLAESDSASKFVPHEYLTAGRPDRLRLLAGLMDTDGNRHKSGFDFVSKSQELATDVVFLARSLGLAASCTRKFCYCQTGAGGWFFRVQLGGDMAEVPCRLARKRPPSRLQKKSVLRTGFKIAPCGKGPFFGFTLDGDHLYVDGHFVVHHNSGKTPVMASVCKDAVGVWGGRVLILAHVKELLEQTTDKLRAVCPEVRFGVYSAGLGRRDTEQPVIVAGIQSVYKRACELDPFDLVIVDESHLIPLDGDGMYRQFLADARTINPQVRIIGFTATPFRLKTGSICTPDGILNHICFEVGVRELIRDGYLCPLITKAGKVRAETADLHVRGGEFVAEEVEDLMDDEALVRSACAEVVEHAAGRNAVLIFASGVRHGRHIVRVLQERHGIECGFVCGETPADERDEALGRFRGDGGNDLFGRRPLKFLCNVNVLTTGFDAPNIDCVAMLRPTMSPGLYYQMVGRAFRLHPGKRDALVLDFGGNILRHGPVDCIKAPDPAGGGPGEAPAKMCPQCRSVIAAGYARCPDCGYEFPPPERSRHDAKAGTAAVLSAPATVTKYKVEDVFYSVHTKRGAGDDAPRSMRVDYQVGWQQHISEWVCFEHGGYARGKAAAWWKRRSPDPVPATAQEAVDIANAGGLASTLSISVRQAPGEQFERVVDWELGPTPEAVADPAEEPDPVGADEVPF